jgi:hypothetical protein
MYTQDQLESRIDVDRKYDNCFLKWYSESMCIEDLH